VSAAGDAPGGAAPEPLATTILAEPLAGQDVPPPLQSPAAAQVLAPQVASAGQVVGALRFYADHPDAPPRPEPLHRLLWGAGVSLSAARLVAADRGLRRAALLPTALTVAGCVVMAAAATALGDPDKREAAGAFHRFLVVFVALASMPPTVLQRLWVRVANEARRALGLPPGEDPTAGRGLVGIWWHEGVKALRQAGATAASLVPLVVVLQLLPFRKTTRAIALAAWGFYWLIVDAFELPMEVVPGPRRGASAPWFARLLTAAPALHRTLRPVAPAGRWLARLSAPWHEELRFTERHPWETLGFALVMGTLLAVPVVGLFFRAVGITAATALLGRLDGTDQP
jgi:hypothetical protein